jgi:hypothetical protein
LLFLIGHAFVASSTHFHPLNGTGANAFSGASLSQSDETQNTPLANEHEQCLICRLQRNFVSDVQQSTPSVVVPRFETLKHEVLQVSLITGAHTLSPPGRAPPPV